MSEPKFSIERQQEIQRNAEGLSRLAAHLAKGEFALIRESPELGLRNVVSTLLLGSVDIAQDVIKLAGKKMPTNVTDWSAWQTWNDYLRLTQNHFDPPIYWAQSVLQLLLDCGFQKEEIVREMAPRAHLWASKDIWNMAARKVSPSDDWALYPDARPKLQ